MRVGELYAELSLRDQDFNKGLDSAERKSGGFLSSFKSMAGQATSVFAGIIGAQVVGRIGSAFAGAISGSSDLAESVSKANVVFGESATAVHDWAKSAATDLGITTGAATEAAGTFGNLFVAMGLGQGAAADMSTDVVELASDLGSFNNLGTDEVLEKLRAGLVGEAEPLRSLGINMNAAAVEAKAMELGLADASGEISEAAKIQARYAIILDQSKTAQGDFARTSDGLANRTKILKARFGDITTQLGQRLLPVITDLAGFVLNSVLPAVERLGARLEGPLTNAVHFVRDGILTLIGALRGDWTSGSGINPLHNALGTVGTVVREQVIPLFERLAGFVTGTLLPAIADVTRFVGSLSEAFDEGGLAGVAKRLLGGLGDVGETLSGFAGSMLTSAGDALWAWVQPQIKPLLKALGGLLLEALGWVKNTGLPLLVAQFGDWGGALIGWVKPQVVPLLAELGSLLVDVGAWILNTGLPALGGQLAAWGTAFWAWISPQIIPLLAELGKLYIALEKWLYLTALPALITQLAEWGHAFVKWVGPQIPPLLLELGKLLFEIDKWILTVALPAIITKLGEWGLAFISWVGPQIPPLLLELGVLLLKVFDWFYLTALPDTIKNLADWGAAFIGWVAKDAIPFIVPELMKLNEKIKTWVVETALPELKSALITWGLAFINWIATDAVPFIVEKLGVLLDKIKTWVTDTAAPAAKTALKDLGTAILEGIEAGIREGFDATLGAALDWAAGKVPEVLKKLWGISSPAQATIPLGGALMQGVAVGFRREWPALEAALREVGINNVMRAPPGINSVIPAPASSISGGSSSGVSGGPGTMQIGAGMARAKGSPIHVTFELDGQPLRTFIINVLDGEVQTIIG